MTMMIATTMITMMTTESIAIKKGVAQVESTPFLYKGGLYVRLFILTVYY